MVPVEKKVKRSTIDTGSETNTVQQPTNNVDPRKQAQRYYREGKIFGRRDEPFFIDIENMPKNLAEMREQLNKYDKMFKRLPASIKDRFENSPEKMIDFLSDKKNLPLAADMGLLGPKLKRAINQEKLKLNRKMREEQAKKAEKKLDESKVGTVSS